MLEGYRGTARFGLAYDYMYRNDSHAPGSADRVLLEEMIFLCPETEPYLYGEYTPLALHYRSGSRPVLEGFVERVLSGCGSVEEQVKAVAKFTAGLGEGNDLDAILLGGTEEEIIARRTDWCTDLARVGCVLFQIAGLPARIVVLADTSQAYSGHVITEVYRSGVWGAVDTTLGIVYTGPDSLPASAADIRRAGGQGQFRSVAIANYFVWESARFNHAVSGLNSYYRSILAMSQEGWPGGLRWLYGEDRG